MNEESAQRAMNMGDLGRKLRAERERRGLTLDDVATKTKISLSCLAAIEEGDRNKLPHPVYAKGFVRNYARLLNLDPDQCASVVAVEYPVAEDDFGDNPVSDNPRAVPTRALRVQNRRSRRQALVVAAVVLVVLAGILLSVFRSSDRDTGEQDAAGPVAVEPETGSAPLSAPEVVGPEVVGPEASQDVAPEILEPAADGPAEPGSEADSVSGQALNITDVPDGADVSAPAESAAHARQPAQVAPVASVSTPGASDVEPEPELGTGDGAQAALPATGQNILDIKATGTCWVLATVDGEIVVDVILYEGQSKRLHYSESLEVKFGNAGGVNLIHNGRRVDFAAESGQVRTFRFP